MCLGSNRFSMATDRADDAFISGGKQSAFKAKIKKHSGQQ